MMSKLGTKPKTQYTQNLKFVGGSVTLWGWFIYRKDRYYF